MEEKKINLTNLSIFGFTVLIGAVTVSIILLYNRKLKLLNKAPLLNNDEAELISQINNIIIFLITLLFLYIGYVDYKYIKDTRYGNIPPEATILFFLKFLPVIQAILLLVINDNDIGSIFEEVADSTFV